MSSSPDGIDVSVIVLNYNGRRWLEGCLTATLGQMDGRQELILVDNASTDDSVEFVRARSPLSDCSCSTGTPVLRGATTWAPGSLVGAISHS